MSTIALRLKDNVFTAGLFFIAISFVIFLVPEMQHVEGEQFGFFAVNFLLTGIYFVVCLFEGRFKTARGGIYIVPVFLVLALISAYALNREMNVFDQSTNWMCVLLIVGSLNYVAFAFAANFPSILKHFMCFLLGVTTLLFTYLAIYLVPLYMVGVAAFFLLGISLHTFVPLLFIIFSIVLLRRILVVFPKGLYSFLVGVVLVLLVAGGFVWKWNSIVSTINKEYRTQLVDGDEMLPAWVRVSQKIVAGPITERVLKAGLAYSLPSDDVSFMRMPERNFGEQQKHDPLVMLSAMTTDRVQLSSEERINILRSLYDNRHQAEERLWSGENLVTDHVHTRLKMWPQLRIAYTEKIITVTNTNKRTWSNSEEAIYTFQLPEGGVVSSLSLWINGQEEKAILTSKEKAATAYNTIVGRERRDPSVIHWQEGNSVSVRVFPVLAGESRMFKVGITSPMAITTGDLVYNNISFEGPSTAGAKEVVKAEVVNERKVIVPSSFNSMSANKFEKEGKYDPVWSLSCSLQPLVPGAFAFDENVYTVAPYTIERSPIDIQKVYLDINSSWTGSEMQDVWELVKSKEVYAYVEGEMLKVTAENYQDVFAALSATRFSLFPFYKIKQPAHSVIVSKSEQVSPNLDELKGSQFLQRLEKAYDPSNKYRLFHLNKALSPYLASLHQKRYFHYEAGDMATLKQVFATNTFARQEENDEEVIIHEAALKLVRKQGSLEQSTAPDHLMRLFSYNHIMQQLGEHPVPAEEIREQLVEEARKSYIVTPFSSLVVLETQADYDRFDIKDKGNSLQNANMKSTGAVPEPHEWALIILVLIVLLYTKYPYLFKRILWKA
ncbi:XrtN system VIT domain-containing protein [Aridibaculum aurantiacum]|uniref:XrtN system VIT domain-containing protein n=1 Tax=Aridibaculum aurantiacum TaxID=2810307 RepID=UPI001A9665CC|nr:XrtN system VIT domain-containing protein [Aridibaculum aurantiacum]